MESAGKYLYCIVRCPKEGTFHGLPPIAMGNGPVHAVAHDGLAAVASDSPVAHYESTRAHLLAHERVLEAVMEEFTLLPVRFGTVAGGAAPDEAIRRLLERRCEEFDALLSEVDGKAEMGVKALWRDEQAMYREVLSQNPSVRRLTEALRGKAGPAAYLDNIRLGKMVSEALHKKKASEAEALLAPLRPLAFRAVLGETILDRMVLNAAFLVEKEQQPAFDRAVNELDNELGRRLAFRYVGPAPPYNFVNIVVTWDEE